ncbi:MAG: DUF1848 domain-containing protein [Chitinispirillaceae bacterium]|jgi:hypothetical protein
MHWPEVTITTGSGETKNAIAPLIISASRATDIPAFYGQWFLRRLDAGYVRWINPFSGKPAKPVYVSLREARLFVFWSKNPRPFFPILEEIDRRGLPCYFHVTINDYEKEGLEQGVPPLAERIETFKQLSGMIGSRRVIWRFDPLIITDTLSPSGLISRIRGIGNELAGHTERLTVSFITLYAKVVRSLNNAGVRIREWDDAGRAAVLKDIGDCARRWGLSAVSCAEDKDYGRYGIAHGKCIDDALIAEVFGHDGKLAEFLRDGGAAKDKGQRPLCRCIISKDIGAYGTCDHRCVYCYAGAKSRYTGRTGRHSIESDSIIPQN